MKTILLFALSLLLSLSVSDVCAQERVYDISQFGLKANSKKNASPVVRKAIAKIKAECRDGEKVILRFPAGRYNFHEAGSTVREYYISNHDQDNPKKVGIALEDMKNLTIDGQGSEFVFYGRDIHGALLSMAKRNMWYIIPVISVVLPRELLKWLPAGFALQSGKMHVWCPAQWWLCVDGDVRLRAFSCHMM